MSAAGAVVLLVGALMLCLLVAHLNTSWQRRTREASLRLEAEAKARAAAREDVPMGLWRLPL